jgi:hypothetical protein
MVRKDKIRYIGIGLMFLTILVILLNAYIKNKKLDKDHRYTIGMIVKIEANARLGHSVYYKFIVNEIKLISYDIIYINYYGYSSTNMENRKFLVKYQPSKPKNCKIMLDYRVKDGVIAPPDGWDSIPILSKKQ